MTNTTKAWRLWWPLALLACGPALAAGGHHGVDDASTLDSGQCELETWASRARGGDRLLHAGANCGVGPVEIGIAGEHGRGGGSSQTQWNLEAKWATAVGENFRVGLDLQPVWQAHARPRHAATRLSALATWTPRQDLAFHLNLGRDFMRGAADLPHHGVAAEWSPAEGWWLTAERFLEQGGHFARIGARWSVAPAWTVDLSRVQRISGAGASNWTLGLSFAFGAD